jgi:hypothetical protein
MSKTAQTTGDHASHTASLKQWIHKTVAYKGLSVQYRVRGNTLHLLCRQDICPDHQQTLLRLIPIFQTTNFSHLLPTDAPPLYQIWLYGCQTSDKRPRWTTTLYLNQLDHHLAQLQDSALATASTSHPSSTPPIHHSAVLTASPTAPQQQATPHSPIYPSTYSSTSLTLSNLALAKRGEEMAIACYLSEALNDLGVSVRVSAKVIPYQPPASVQKQDSLHPALPLTAQLTTQRLWVACEAAYSPDPLLLSDPVTQKLRELEIEGFHDAVMLFQVTGETKPDWVLRVDLTTPAEMLREWARWGDVEAIRRLLNQDIAALHIQITTATLNATTLHLCCSNLPLFDELDGQLDRQLDGQAGGVIESHKRAKADIGLLLEAIAPQGIHAATVYGHVPAQEAPLWVEWLDLPASQHPALAESAIALAKQGDWSAIAFLLHRLLNPNLDEYLQSGGIRLQLLPKQDLLHVMCEASHCPDRKQVIPALIRFLRQLDLPEISGVRLYGRRAGQKKPLWSYGLDFSSRSRLVPEVSPEFAATDAYVEDLLPQPGQSLVRPDLTPADIQTAWTKWQQRLDRTLRQTLQQAMLRTHLFSFAASDQQVTPVLPGQGSGGVKTMLVWGAAGLLLLVQTNWLFGQITKFHLNQAASQKANQVTSQTPQSPQNPQASSANAERMSPSASEQTASEQTASEQTASASKQANVAKTQPQLKPATGDQGNQAGQSAFNTSSFTQSDPEDIAALAEANPPTTSHKGADKLPYTPHSQTATLLTAEILAEESKLPSFNSRQMDEKLQLYYRFVENFGVPDVLVVGSSRALRGVDPIALQAELADMGYSNAKIFNFGINGATAQVVDLLVQHVLTREQLPRMIIWADGARAFNSGAPDTTYDGVIASEAYRQLLAGTLPVPAAANAGSDPSSAELQSSSLNRSLTTSYESIDRWLSQQLAILVGRQTDRDQLKQALQTGMTALLPMPEAPAQIAQGQTGQAAKILQTGQTLPDESGFLSLPMQFNPATYYQKYARVLGVYDSDYANFQLNGKQEAALQSLLKFTEASQIPLVFVNLPLTEDYLDPVRLEYEQEFRDYLVRLSLNHSGFVFRDLSEQWTTQYRYFSDPSHLNRYGAYAVAVRLAQDAKIPWVKSEQTAGQTGSKQNRQG